LPLRSAGAVNAPLRLFYCLLLSVQDRSPAGPTSKGSHHVKRSAKAALRKTLGHKEQNSGTSWTDQAGESVGVGPLDRDARGPHLAGGSGDPEC
jgi:hypothetical protein